MPHFLFSSACPSNSSACLDVASECRLTDKGLELLSLDRPEIDMDRDVEAGEHVEAKLSQLLQDLAARALPRILAKAFGETATAATFSASLDVPVNVERGLVLLDVCVWFS